MVGDVKQIAAPFVAKRVLIAVSAPDLKNRSGSGYAADLGSAAWLVVLVIWGHEFMARSDNVA